MSDQFDPQRLTLKRSPAQQQEILAVPRHERGERFLKGPIPWNWLGLAAKQSGRALHVAIALWFLVGIKKTPTVKLSGPVLRALGVGHDSARRGLQKLETAKLVSVERKNGRSPIVTVLKVQGLDERPDA